MAIELIWRIVATFGLGMIVGSLLTIAWLRPYVLVARKSLEADLARTPQEPDQ